MEQGEYDAVIDNAALDPYIYGRFPTAFYPLALYVRHDFPEHPFSWDIMKGKTVGMVLGYDYTEKVAQFTGWNKQFAETDEQMLSMLLNKRQYYVVLDVFSANELVEEGKIKRLRPLIDTTNLYLVFNKQKKEVAQRYDEVIGQMIQDGTIDRIYEKYLPYSYSDLTEDFAADRTLSRTGGTNSEKEIVDFGDQQNFLFTEFGNFLESAAARPQHGS